MKEANKHRLIGGAILVAIAVLFLPSFFKDKQQYQVDTSSHIPERPTITAVDFNEPTQPDGIEPAPAPETMFIPTESAAVAATASSVISQSVTTSSVSSLGASVPEIPLNEAGLPNAWVIQVASLGNKSAATKLRDKLQADGYKAYLRSVKAGNTEVHRIYIGPKLDKAEAVRLKAELDKRLKVNSLVLPFKP